ncbi:hypothetical protein BDF22DRAFT_689908 [Syncephalis plumigaleata]|nr:hypothetical protein BDF22DRAFT_689908 [Syncephalis plumigaleata]
MKLDSVVVSSNRKRFFGYDITQPGALGFLNLKLEKTFLRYPKEALGYSNDIDYYISCYTPSEEQEVMSKMTSETINILFNQSCRNYKPASTLSQIEKVKENDWMTRISCPVYIKEINGHRCYINARTSRYDMILQTPVVKAIFGSKDKKRQVAEDLLVQMETTFKFAKDKIGWYVNWDHDDGVAITPAGKIIFRNPMEYIDTKMNVKKEKGFFISSGNGDLIVDQSFSAPAQFYNEQEMQQMYNEKVDLFFMNFAKAYGIGGKEDPLAQKIETLKGKVKISQADLDYALRN